MDWMPPSTDEWSKRNQQALQGLLNINQFLPVTGDIQSGLLAAQDVRNQKYGSAALNALGVLPFLPALGGVTKIAKEIRPPKESLYDVASSNFDFALPVGNKTVDIKSLKGMVSASAYDQNKIKNLASKIKSPEGYIERLIIDDKGNVLEGQHRLQALRQIGQSDVPVSIIKDMSSIVDNVKKSGLRSEQARNIVQNAYEMVNEVGSAKKAMEMYDIPKEYKKAYEIAFKNL